ncbi:hypothetical protein BT69DRAFT_191423 [Atractiella rhizophila]|nr:hypothetical protein BT69DRAFT_191423 [Atractiella rhizophila]
MRNIGGHGCITDVHETYEHDESSFWRGIGKVDPRKFVEPNAAKFVQPDWFQLLDICLTPARHTTVETNSLPRGDKTRRRSTSDTSLQAAKSGTALAAPNGILRSAVTTPANANLAFGTTAAELANGERGSVTPSPIRRSTFSHPSPSNYISRKAPRASQSSLQYNLSIVESNRDPLSAQASLLPANTLSARRFQTGERSSCLSRLVDAPVDISTNTQSDATLKPEISGQQGTDITGHVVTQRAPFSHPFIFVLAYASSETGQFLRHKTSRRRQVYFGTYVDRNTDLPLRFVCPTGECGKLDNDRFDALSDIRRHFKKRHAALFDVFVEAPSPVLEGLQDRDKKSYLFDTNKQRYWRSDDSEEDMYEEETDVEAQEPLPWADWGDILLNAPGNRSHELKDWSTDIVDAPLLERGLSLPSLPSLERNRKERKEGQLLKAFKSVETFGKHTSISTTILDLGKQENRQPVKKRIIASPQIPLTLAQVSACDKLVQEKEDLRKSMNRSKYVLDGCSHLPVDVFATPSQNRLVMGQRLTHLNETLAQEQATARKLQMDLRKRGLTIDLVMSDWTIV